MKRDYKLYIEDIKDSISQIEEYIKNVSEEVFRKDRKLQDAVIRRLQIIGEASRNIPRSLKEKNKHVSWFSMSQLRDLITHSYFEIGINRIWRAIKEDLPKIKDSLRILKLV